MGAKIYSLLITEIINTTEIELLKISEKDSRFKVIPSQWSFRQILGHLIDSAHNNYRRIVLSQLQEDLVFEGYAQDKWVLINRYHEKDFNQIIDLWKTMNFMIIDLIDTLNDQDLSKMIKDHNFDFICMNRVSKQESTNLSYLVWDYIFHLEHHLKQILPNYIPHLKEHEQYY